MDIRENADVLDLMKISKRILEFTTLIKRFQNGKKYGDTVISSIILSMTKNERYLKFI